MRRERPYYLDDDIDALAYLYMEKIDTSQMTPTDFLHKHLEVWKEMKIAVPQITRSKSANDNANP